MAITTIWKQIEIEFSVKKRILIRFKRELFLNSWIAIVFFIVFI